MSRICPAPARVRLLAALLLTVILGGPALADGQPVTWTFDETTTGQDIFWMSNTTVDPSSPRYFGEFEITGVWVTVPLLGQIDVLSLIPPELLLNMSVINGPAPVVVIQDSIIFPAPPEPPSIAADIVVRIDAAGHGVFEATNVILGTVVIPIFGNVQILALRVAGRVTMTPIPRSDVNGDCVINVFDLLGVLAEWGVCPPAPSQCPGDVTRDGMVNVFDLLQVLADWGT